MVGIIDVDLTTGKGLTISTFALAVVLLLLVTGGFTVILGAAIVGFVLLLAYYLGVRAHRKLAGKKRRQQR